MSTPTTELPDRTDIPPPTAPPRPPEPRASLGFWLLTFGTVVAVGLLAWVQYLRAERSGRGRSAPVPVNLPVAIDLPEFSLTERSGKQVTRDSLRGKVWIADFIFTNCAGPCPIMSQRMAGLQAELDRLRWTDVRLVSISVDPVRDTPEVLARYASRYGASTKQWLFLTGSNKEIFDLCMNGFKMSVFDATDQDPIAHDTKLAVVDRRGRVRAYFDYIDDDPDLQTLAERPVAGNKGEVDVQILRAVQALLEERPG